MTAKPSPGRRIGTDPEPPGNELAAVLWVIAVLLAVYELIWWVFDRMYTG
jgi:hypothetical protein